MEHLRIGLMSFVQVFLVALQTRNCAQSRYLAGFLTSLFIGATWLVIVHDMVVSNFSWDKSAVYILCQAVGWLTGTYIHKTYFGKKDHEKW